jgi:amidophosphoribosyltransferase
METFVFRDPAGITSRLFYQDDEIVVVFERPVIQTVFNVPFEKYKRSSQEMIIKKEWNDFYEGNFASNSKKSMFFERIYFF